MLQCRNNVPRLLSHQHQKLRSSSHCFHCSTTCSPVHTHTHTLTHSLYDYPHLCFSQSPPPLPLYTLSMYFTERHPPTHTHIFPPLSLHLPSLPLLQCSLLDRLICDAAHKVLYAAICVPVQHIRAIQKQPYVLLSDQHPHPCSNSTAA